VQYGVRRQRARNEPGDAAFCERGLSSIARRATGEARERITDADLKNQPHLLIPPPLSGTQSGVAGSYPRTRTSFLGSVQGQLASATALQVSARNDPAERRRRGLRGPKTSSFCSRICSWLTGGTPMPHWPLEEALVATMPLSWHRRLACMPRASREQRRKFPRGMIQRRDDAAAPLTCKHTMLSASRGQPLVCLQPVQPLPAQPLRVISEIRG
jgi:hypothetical protein